MCVRRTCDTDKQRHKGTHDRVHCNLEMICSDFVGQLFGSLCGLCGRVDSAHVHRDKQPICKSLRRGDLARILEATDPALVHARDVRGESGQVLAVAKRRSLWYAGHCSHAFNHRGYATDSHAVYGVSCTPPL